MWTPHVRSNSKSHSFNLGLLLVGGVFSLILGGASNAQASPTSVLEASQRAAGSFSRLQQLINLQRSIKPPVVAEPGAGGSSQGQFMGELPVPREILAQASQISDAAESLGCELKLVEKPKVEIRFGDQVIPVIPFDFFYTGKECALDLRASMTVETLPGEKDTIHINVDMDFNLLNEKQRDIFGMTHAKMSQKALIKAHLEPGKQALEVSIDSKTNSEGGPDGPVALNQKMAMSFAVLPPLSFSAVSEDSHGFSVKGESVTLRRRQELVGLSPKIEYWFDNQLIDQTQFEKVLQGLRFVGINEQESAQVGTLACSIHFFDSQQLSSEEKAAFQTSGARPSKSPKFEYKVCGKTKSQAVGPFAVDVNFGDKWQLTTVRGAGTTPLSVYFLYDEDSFFIRDIDNHTLLMACFAKPKCGGTP